MNKEIKVLTYNICHGMDYTNASSPTWVRDWRNIRLDKTAGVIKNVNADIVGLNEVYNSGGKDLDNQVGVIANLANYENYFFGKAIVFNGNWAYGNAFISKFKILESQTFLVPAPVGNERRENENLYYEDRVLIRVVIDFYGTPVSVYVTHFGLNLQEQERMVLAILNRLNEEKNPHVLMGDFNAEPNAEALRPLYNKMQSAAKRFNNVQKTFSTFKEELQIDYIFFSNDFTITKFERINENVSDHYPIFSILSFASGK